MSKLSGRIGNGEGQRRLTDEEHVRSKGRHVGDADAFMVQFVRKMQDVGYRQLGRCGVVG